MTTCVHAATVRDMGDDERARREAAELETERARAQPIADAIETAGASYDAARAAIGGMVAPYVTAGQRSIAERDYESAARLFEKVALFYRDHGLRGDADQWDHRAADCRSAGRHAKRLRKKGKGR